MYVDAAAFVAILSQEVEKKRCEDALATSENRTTSAIALWEAAHALASTRKLDISLEDSQALLSRFIDDRGISLIQLPPASVSLAFSIHASAQYGSGKRRLNLADCFHYACAKHYGLPILSTDDEFRLTDIEVVP